MPTRITLTTDFGTRDSYVAELKGVLYAQGPASLELVDLSHEIGAQDLREAALFVRAAWPRFPPGTIHLVVVDPGVGSARRALALELRGQQLLGPDNGVMSLLFDGSERAVTIDPTRLGSEPISATFHGRDVFAPAAARLAQGTPLAVLGPVARELVRLALPVVSSSSSQLQGEVIHVDRFGNLITNIARSDLAPWAGQDVRVHLAGSVPLPLAHCYADAAVGCRLALIGSSELLEIALNQGNAAVLSGARVGSVVQVRPARIQELGSETDP
jgi:S-adenosylmethionine hydrolase